ncbi:MAG: nuclear transport factor 2 family protein [Bacteroidota bacterium]
MKNSQIFIVLLILTILSTACGSQTVVFDKAKVRSEIDAANAVFMENVNEKGGAGMADVYTEDGKWMIPNSPTLDGRMAIGEAFAGLFGSGQIHLELITDDIHGNNEMVVEEGRGILSTKTGYIIDDSKYLVIWKKEAGEWKIFLDMYNSNLNVAGDNVKIVESWYETVGAGDLEPFLAAMTEETVWNEAENFPYAGGNPYIGPENVLQGVFVPIGAEWEYWKTTNLSFLGTADGNVIVTGVYEGKHKTTGKTVAAQFVHHYVLTNDGKMVSFQQYTDTKQVAAAMQ